MSEAELQRQINALRDMVESMYRVEAGSAAVDYSGTSTITGWTSYTTKVLTYTKIGKLVAVEFVLAGTSDSATTTVTLPYSVASGLDSYGLIYAIDNGGTPAVGKWQVTTSTLYLTPTLSAAYTGWTASGAKTARGWALYFTA